MSVSRLGAGLSYAVCDVALVQLDKPGWDTSCIVSPWKPALSAPAQVIPLPQNEQCWPCSNRCPALPRPALCPMACISQPAANCCARVNLAAQRVMLLRRWCLSSHSVGLQLTGGQHAGLATVGLCVPGVGCGVCRTWLVLSIALTCN